MKNQIIIQDITFNINNFNDTGMDYKVNVYAVDPEESDEYTVVIINDITGQEELVYHTDSSGNLSIDEYNKAQSSEIGEVVHETLFNGIIKEF